MTYIYAYRELVVIRGGGGSRTVPLCSLRGQSTAFPVIVNGSSDFNKSLRRSASNAWIRCSRSSRSRSASPNLCRSQSISYRSPMRPMMSQARAHDRNTLNTSTPNDSGEGIMVPATHTSSGFFI
jgi:hypothetical protein